MKDKLYARKFNRSTQEFSFLSYGRWESDIDNRTFYSSPCDVYRAMLMSLVEKDSDCIFSIHNQEGIGETFLVMKGTLVTESWYRNRL
jgi:hypothetical protein